MEQFEEDWADLSEGLRKIYAGERLRDNRYTKLFTGVFNLCSFSTYRPPNGALAADFVGERLYYKLKAFITTHVKNLYQELQKSEQDEKFLEHYIALWKAYKSGSFDINGVFAYLNRHWVNREMEAGNKDVLKVYDLAMNIWKAEMFDKILSKIKQSVFNALIAEENGSRGDKVRIGKLIKTVSESFFGLGIKRIFQTHKPEEAELVYLLALY